MSQTIVPDHGKCFVCGTSNPRSIGMQWMYDSEGQSLSGTITLTEAHQGPPQHAHGGASSALLDEAMGLSVWAAGYRVLAVNLNVNFQKPVPLGVPVTVRGRVTGQEGKKVFTSGELILPDGKVAVSATGIFVNGPEDILGNVGTSSKK